MNGGGRGKGVYVNISLHTRIHIGHTDRKVNQVKGASKMVEEIMFRTEMKTSHKYTSLKRYCKVLLKCTELNPFW